MKRPVVLSLLTGILIVAFSSVISAFPTVIEPFHEMTGWTLEYFADGVSSFQSGDLANNDLSIIQFEGERVAKFDYDFTTQGSDAIQIHLSKALEGRTQRFGLWVYGDDSGHILLYEVIDSEGEIFFTWFGSIDWIGWRYVESDVVKDRFSVGSAAVGGDGTVDFPVVFNKLTLVDREPRFEGSGTIYLKDLQGYGVIDRDGDSEARDYRTPPSEESSALIVPGVFPRANVPSKQLTVLESQKVSWDMQLLLASLQGLVNREQPQLYLINYDQDLFWLEWLVERGYVDTLHHVKDALPLFKEFEDAYQGVIITDPQLTATTNVAAMLGSVENALVVTPSVYEYLKNHLHDLHIIDDLRGRWTSHVAAYEWAFANLWPEMNHQAIALMYPTTSSQYPRDYLIQHKIFTFFVHGKGDHGIGVNPSEERDFFEMVLRETPPNIPVMGWPSYGDQAGISEYETLKLSSQYAKFLPVTEFSSNLSVHSGYSVDDVRWKQPAFDREPPSYDPSKVYVSVSVLDSGDAAWYWQRNQKDVWRDPARGRIPIGWALNPLVAELTPTILEWYYTQLTDRDELYTAMSGIGYMFAPEYGRRLDNHERVLDAYIQESNTLMKRLDLRAVALYVGSWGESAFNRELFERYIDGIDQMNVLLPGFGRHFEVTAENANYMLNDTPVMHMQTSWMAWDASKDLSSRTMDSEISHLVESIRDMAQEQRPAFITAMATSWTVPPIAVLRAQQILGDEYIFVTPSELAYLFTIANEE